LKENHEIFLASAGFPSNFYIYKNEGKPMFFNEMSNNQRHIFIDTAQLYDAFMMAYHKSRAYRGGMHRKKSKSRIFI